MLAFSRTGRQNLNGGKVGADDETGQTVKPGVGVLRRILPPCAGETTR